MRDDVLVEDVNELGDNVVSAQRLEQLAIHKNWCDRVLDRKSVV